MRPKSRTEPRERTVRRIERLHALTHLVSSAEYLRESGYSEPGGMGNWSHNRDKFSSFPHTFRRFLDFVAKKRVRNAIFIVRIAASTVLLLPTKSVSRGVSDALLALTSIALYPQNHYGTDGADQVCVQSAAATALTRAFSSPRSQDAVLWYLALQSGLAYATSGWIKLLGSDWRSGAAVAGVMRTRTYGNKKIWRIMHGNPRLATVSAHAMLAFECLFPLVFLVRGKLVNAAVAGATIFHCGIASAMGLGRFATAFGSMLPAITYVTKNKSCPRLPRLVLFGTLGIAAWGTLDSLARRRRLHQRSLTMEKLKTRAGNFLALKRERRASPRRLTLVFECGLLSTPDHYEWVVRELPRDAGAIRYLRAGYPPSITKGRTFTVHDRAEDLADILATLDDEDGEIYLVGHSLGAAIFQAAARSCKRRISGVIYIDPAHPAQLEDERYQKAMSTQMEGVFQCVPESLRAGLGWLITRVGWGEGLPPSSLRALKDQMKDARHWQTGRDEWLGYSTENPDGYHSELPVRALLIGSEQAARDAHQSVLFKNFVEAHSRSTHATVLQSDHNNVLSVKHHAQSVAQLILSFVEEEHDR